MPPDMGPGAYNITRGDQFLNRRRLDLCIAKMEPLGYCVGEFNGQPGFTMVGDALQFDPIVQNNYNTLISTSASKNKRSLSVFKTRTRYKVEELL